MTLLNIKLTKHLLNLTVQAHGFYWSGLQNPVNIMTGFLGLVGGAVMSHEIWFFTSLLGDDEITVLNKRSAKTLVQMMTAEQRSTWNVMRGNRVESMCRVCDCAELISESDSKQPSVLHSLSPIETTVIKFGSSKKNVPNKPHAVVSAHVAAKKSMKPLPPPPQRSIGLASKSSTVDKRKQARKDARLRVVVVSGGRCFRGYSRNISAGGVMLDKNIPAELFGSECRIIIGSADMKENIEFQAKLVGDPKQPRSFAFTQINEQFLFRLMDWVGLSNSRQKQAA